MDEEPLPQRSWLSAYGPLVALGALLLIALAVLFFTAVAVNQPPPAPTGPPPGSGRPPGPPNQGMDSKTIYETVQGIVRKSGGDWEKVTRGDRETLDKIMQGSDQSRAAFERMKQTLENAKSLATPAPAKSKP